MNLVFVQTRDEVVQIPLEQIGGALEDGETRVGSIGVHRVQVVSQSNGFHEFDPVYNVILNFIKQIDLVRLKLLFLDSECVGELMHYVHRSAIQSGSTLEHIVEVETNRGIHVNLDLAFEFCGAILLVLLIEIDHCSLPNESTEQQHRWEGVGVFLERQLMHGAMSRIQEVIGILISPRLGEDSSGNVGGVLWLGRIWRL